MQDFTTLVLQAQAGDELSMDTVMRYMDKKIRISLRGRWKEIPGGHDVEDMTQFALIGVLKGIQTFKQGAGTKAINWLWMHVVSVVNNEAKYMRCLKRKVNINKSSLDTPVIVGKNGNQELTLGDMLPSEFVLETEVINNVEYEELYNSLMHYLTKLERKVLYYMVDGLPSREIVQKTGLQYKVVDNAKSRIKQKALVVLGRVG